MEQDRDRVRTGRTDAISISPHAGSGKITSGRTTLLRAMAGGFPVGWLSRSTPGRKVLATRRKMGMDITWVTERIAIGGGIWNAENMAWISRAGITHIIDMQIEFDDTPLAGPHGIVVCWNPVDDDFEPKSSEVFARGVEFALEALKQDDTKIYVHCAAGVHRAPMMALALLGVMGWTLEDGMDLIEGRRPVADFADVYVRSVENFLQGRG